MIYLQSIASVQAGLFLHWVAVGDPWVRLGAWARLLRFLSRRRAPSCAPGESSRARGSPSASPTFSSLSADESRRTSRDRVASTRFSSPSPRKSTEVCQSHASCPEAYWQARSLILMSDRGHLVWHYCPNSTDLSVICAHIFHALSGRFYSERLGFQVPLHDAFGPWYQRPVAHL